jgi:hypothetical protein
MAKEFYKARALSCDSNPEDYTWSNIKKDLKELSKIWKCLPPDIKHFFEEDVQKLDSKLAAPASAIFSNQLNAFFFTQNESTKDKKFGAISGILSACFVVPAALIKLSLIPADLLYASSLILNFSCDKFANFCRIQSLKISKSDKNVFLKELCHLALLSFELLSRTLSICFSVLATPIEIANIIITTYMNDVYKNAADPDSKEFKKILNVLLAGCVTGIAKGLFNGTLALFTKCVHVAKSSLSLPLSLVRRPVVAFKKAFIDKQTNLEQARVPS